MNIPYLDHLRRKDLVGMDIGNHSTKFFRWNREKNVSVALYYPGTILEGREEDAQELRKFVHAHGLSGASVACAVDEEAFKVKKIELPKMPENDLKEAVKWQMRDAVEGPIEECVTRHLVLEEHPSSEGTKVFMMGFVIKTGDVRALVQFLRKCSLKPVVLEPAPISLVATFGQLEGFQKGKHYGVIDLGEQKTVFMVIGDGKWLFTRHLTNISGLELKAHCVKELAITDDEAESLSHLLIGETPLQPDLEPLLEKAEPALASYFNRFAIEIQGSVDAFAITFRRQKIDRIFLCGGGATLRGLKEHLSENLAIPTGVLDPSAKFGVKADAPHLYNVAVGMAQYSL